MKDSSCLLIAEFYEGGILWKWQGGDINTEIFWNILRNHFGIKILNPSRQSRTTYLFIWFVSGQKKKKNIYTVSGHIRIFFSCFVSIKYQHLFHRHQQLTVDGSRILQRSSKMPEKATELLRTTSLTPSDMYRQSSVKTLFKTSSK